MMNGTAVEIIITYRKAFVEALDKQDTNAIFLMYLYDKICEIAKGRKIETDMQLKQDIIKKLYEIKKQIQRNLQEAIEQHDDFIVSCMQQNITIMEKL